MVKNDGDVGVMIDEWSKKSVFVERIYLEW